MKFTITLYEKPLVHNLWEKINVTIPLTLDRQAEAENFTELKSGAYYTIDIREVDESKTLPQNAYVWRMITDIAKYERKHGHNISKNAAYRHYVREYGECNDIAIKSARIAEFERIWTSHGSGWQIEVLDNDGDMANVACYNGMSEWSKKQVSDFIEMLQRECIERNISIERF